MALKDKYKIERKYITNSLARSKQKLNGPKFLVAHETANNKTGADGHYNYFQGITFQASAHTFIDDKKILEIIPIDEKAWHVQYNQDKRTLGLGYANDNAIGPELCRPGHFEKAYDRYVWYFAYLCHKFGLKPKQHITAHKFEDPQRRSDPQSWLEPNGVTWEQFLNDVQLYYDGWDGEVKPTPQPSKPSTNKSTASKDTVVWVGTSNKGKRIESIYKGSDKLNFYDGPRWNNPSGTFGYKEGWIVDNLYRVNGSLMYRVQNSKGDLYYITASDKYVRVVGNSAPANKNVTSYKGDSIVDYLNLKGNKHLGGSSFNNRKKLAGQHGIKNYRGTASQNIALLNKLRG